MKLNPKRKKWIIAAAALVTAGAIGAGIWFGTQSSSDSVNVYAFQFLGMTEYWGDSQESYGPVSTDRIQTVFLSDTQTVTEIRVQPGDTVKKGDLLMTFDTTLSDIALERKRLDVEKLKLQHQDAKERLQEIRNMKPMVIPQDNGSDKEDDKNKGTALTEAYMLSNNSDYDGSAKEKSLICWLNSATGIDDDIMEAARVLAEQFQNENAKREASSASAVPQEQTGEPSEPETSEPDASEDPSEPDPSEPEPSEPEKPYEPFNVYDYYVIFKVTEGNMSLGNRKTWQGMHITGSKGGGFRFKLFDAYGITDHMLVDQGGDAADTSRPQIDYGSGYTSAQLAQMRAEQEKTIKDLEFDIKMAEAEYKIMQTEMGDGNVYSQIDGEVVAVLTEDEAKMTRQPILKVSGGGGFFMEGSVSELEKDKLKIGQEVTVNDWNTGMTYTGTVESIGDFPKSDGYWNGMGNPNATYYPFRVFIDGSADLQAGSYISITYSTSEGENGIYLEKAFIRTEQGQSYVYVRGADGSLEKRQVVTGKSLWGNYTEILSGLSAEDFLAFPYGKNLKEGAQTVESDISALYEQ